MYARLDGFAEKMKIFWLPQRLQVLGPFAGIRVRAKSINKSVCDVHLCGSFSGVPLSQKLHQACNLRSHFAHFLEQNSKKKPFFVFKTILEHPYPVLEHPFLLWYVLSCFSTSYFVSEQQQKNVEELLKKIWTCKVQACNQKNGRISPFRFCIDILWNCKCDFKIISAPVWLSANNIILGHQR